MPARSDNAAGCPVPALASAPPSSGSRVLPLRPQYELLLLEPRLADVVDPRESTELSRIRSRSSRAWIGMSGWITLRSAMQALMLLGICAEAVDKVMSS
eukprot:scaffold21153_cov34-Tisochrysis_lutea.AAC.4